MKKRVLFTFLYFITFTGFAQNYQLLDSLRARMSETTGPELFAVLNDIGFQYRLSHPDSTIYYCNKAYDYGKSIGLEKELSKPISFIGLANAYKGNYSASFDAHNQAIQIALQQQDSIQLAYCYNNFGRLFFDQGDMVRAYEQLKQAGDLFSLLKDEAGLAYVYRSLSGLYASQKDYDKAIAMAYSAYELRLNTGNQRSIISSLSEIGQLYQSINENSQAIESYRKADSLARLIHDQISIAEIKLGLAEVYLNTSQMEQGYEEIQQAYQIISQLENVKLSTNAFLLLGKYYFQTNRFDKAISYLTMAVEEAQKASTIAPQRDAYFYLGKIYQKKGDESQANLYTNKYLILNETLQNVELTRQIERLQFQLEIEKKEKENERLKASEEQNLLIIQRQRIQSITLGVVAVLAIIVVVLIYRNNKRKVVMYHKLAIQRDEIARQREEIEHRNEVLQDRNKELADLNNEKDTLMNIVAHDLKGPLSRIRGFTEIMMLEGNLSEGQKRYIMMIRAEVKAGSELILDLLDVNNLEGNREELHITKVFLENFLSELVATHAPAAQAKNIQIKLNVLGKPQPVTDAGFLSRMLENLLSNAIKFSSPSTLVKITAWSDGPQVKISLKDEGPGFSEEDKKLLYQKFKLLSARPTAGESSNGLGLAIVKILADRINARIELNSSLGNGSEFIITLPMV
ncbi:tetratricopeptide repeat protein [Cytophagales bacterium LB-30]|uniref:histidine kinase n=1 Tax=Shiella aurantiaca TaxID=3058365 RepID=A0ABT8F2Z9_9BACT|nr:ATP-binding protein [Shiella aurantiaca]MDN4164734.1 tetratricopeptide repeat protein [Shiella aurantiaca]